MGDAHDRRTTQGALLVVALLAAELAGPIADPPAAEAAEPSATANCGRGENLDFDVPSTGFTDGERTVANDTPGLGWTSQTDSITLHRKTDDGEFRHYAHRHSTTSDVISQSFPTLPGDRIAWAIEHSGREGHQSHLQIGAERREMPIDNNAVWITYSGTYEVPDEQARTTTISVEIGVQEYTNIDKVKLDLTCEIAITVRFVGFDGDGGVGDTARFRYEVTNEGSASLQNLVVSDKIGTVISCPSDKETLLRAKDPDDVDNDNRKMTCPGAYKVQQSDVDRGRVTSAATVSADDATEEAAHKVTAAASADSTEIPAGPGLAVSGEKAVVNTGVVAPSDRVDAGDTAMYSFKVTNTGDVTLGSISVSVPGAKTANCPGAPLAPGGSAKCEAVIVLTQAQIDAGSYSGEAKVTATTKRGDVSVPRAVNTTLDSAPAVSLDKMKTAPAGKVTAGGKVSYSFKAANTGNVTLTGLSVADPKTGKVTCPKTTLAPKAPTTFTATYVATPADIAAGIISNKATATATVKAADGKTVTASDSVSFSTGTGKAAAGRIAGKDPVSYTHLTLPTKRIV